MKNRRHFIKQLTLGTAGVIAGNSIFAREEMNQSRNGEKPIVLSTWRHGLAANEGAWAVLKDGGNALDAVEKGVSVTEADLSNLSVGLGGLPDRDGFVTLDACIMDHESRCGSVGFLQHILHPIQVARKIMDTTPHIMLVGEGAYEFALKNGFERSIVDVPQPKAAERYSNWLIKSQYEPPVNIENHDTIGMIAQDSNGNLSGACTTSGLGYKIHGRVGDSPIIGAGLFVDNEVGAATATGVGEMVIRIAGSHTVVELMRAGATPDEACKAAVERIIKKHPSVENKQVGFLALNKNGDTGAYAIHKGFNYAVQNGNGNAMTDSLFDRA
jgi:N4-(beta-N-acetylglucosaminyl)-L-asparaginase